MKRLLGACALLAATSFPAAAADQCPPLRIAASVNMIVERGQILVPVTLGDEQVYFAVGTAQPYSAISASYAEAHKFTRIHSDVSFVGLSGEVSNVAAIVPSFGFSRLRAENTTFITTNMHDEAAAPGALVPRGVLGADFLRAYDVEFDFAGAKLNLISRDHCDVMPVYWPSQTLAKVPMIVRDDNKISFKMTLDGHELQTVMNTAMPGSTIRLNIAKEVYDLDNDSPGNIKAGKLGDGTLFYAHRFKSLSVDGLAISNPVLALMPSLADKKIEHMRNMYVSPSRGPMYYQQQPELVLGLNELKHLHVYIDYHHQMVYLTPATEPAQVAAHPAAGP